MLKSLLNLCKHCFVKNELVDIKKKKTSFILEVKSTNQ